MKKVFKFWTKEEDALLLKTYEKCQSQSETARILAPKLGRNFHAVQGRTSKLLLHPNRVKYTRSRKSSDKTKGVTLPAGFTFDIKPTRVVMFTDHVRLYF